MSEIVYDPYEKVSLDKFMPRIAAELPGAPLSTIRAYISDFIFEFCKRTQVVTREITITLEPCVTVYKVTPQDCTHIVSIKSVCFEANGHCSEWVHLRNKEPCYRECLFYCGGKELYLDQDGTLSITPPIPFGEPSQKLTLIVCVVPSRDACEVDAILYERYKEEIVQGVLSEMLLMNGTPWFNPNLAAQRMRKTEVLITNAHIRRLLGTAGAPLKFHHRRFL